MAPSADIASLLNLIGWYESEKLVVDKGVFRAYLGVRTPPMIDLVGHRVEETGGHHH